MGEDSKELKNYTRIFNPILEALCRHSKYLNSTDYAVLLCVIRLTYGWRQKSHPMSKTLIMQKTGMSEPTVKRSVQKLLELSYLIDYGIDKKTKCRVLGLNKKYSEWNSEGFNVERVNVDTQGGSKLILNGGSMLNTEGVKVEPQKRKPSKDTLSKERKSKDMSPKKTIFLSSSGIAYTEIKDGFGFWRDKNGVVNWEEIEKGKQVE